MNGPHEENEVLNGRYEIISYVNMGGMQYVYKAHDNVLGKIVALKTPKNSSAQKRFKRSAVLSAKVNHPNIAKTLDFFVIDDRQYLIEEFIDGSDLGDVLNKISKRMDPYLVAKTLHYLAKGIAAAHHVEVVHRDLKPSNVMVSDPINISGLKITDFGIAKMAGEELTDAAEGGDSSISTSQTAVGALPYMAPEAILTPKEVTVQADIWSIGAMAYELLVGAKPFGSGLPAVAKIIAAEPPAIPAALTANPQFSALSKELIAIILSCLEKNPNTRPTADQLVEKCGTLCYPLEDRDVGTVNEIRYNSWGFINVNGEDVFFHLNSVYGDIPVAGDNVMLSKYPGAGAWRAHPVVKIM